MYSSLTPHKKSYTPSPIGSVAKPSPFASPSPFIQEHSVFYTASKKCKQSAGEAIAGDSADGIVSSPALVVGTAPLFHHLNPASSAQATKVNVEAQHEIGRLKHQLSQQQVEAERTKLLLEAKITRVEGQSRFQQDRIAV